MNLKIMYKFYFFVLTLIIPSSIFSQEINEEFYKSLPEDIREDLLKRAGEKESLEEKVYRSIDVTTDIKKEDLIEDIFGIEFFDTIQTSFMPINSPNTDDNYILDFGDVLSIQLIGQNDSIESYPIGRDGSINIPDIGKLFIAGLPLVEVSKIIDAKIQQTYIGVESYTSLKNIRDVSVLVAGNASNPGIYTLSGNSNMLHALNVAGGISEYGSYRNIKLIRDEKTIEVIDIYNILTKGITGSKTRLRSGDVIFVEPRGPVVQLQGGFKRVTRYELLKSQKLSSAIEYANGTTYDSDFSNIFLYRMIEGEIKPIKISSMSQFNNIDARDEDRIFLRRYSFRNVEISGAVLRPGAYRMIEGQNVYDLIEKAGGYSNNAFPGGAIYLNEEAKLINKNASEKLYMEFIDGLLAVLQQSPSGQSDMESMIVLAENIKNTEPVGRVIVDLEKDKNPALLVKDKDSLHIPEKTNNIYIFGEVINQGSILFDDGSDLNFYLTQKSGLKDSADKNSIYILYPNGTTSSFSLKRNLFAIQPKSSISIVPGSVIYVPRKFDNTLSTRLSAQAYAAILGNIGVSLASLSAITD